METFGYYSTDTQLKGTLDTKLLLKQAHIDTLIKEAYYLIKGENEQYEPIIRDLKTLFFGLNNVW